MTPVPPAAAEQENKRSLAATDLKDGFILQRVLRDQISRKIFK
jgi:hypothetical protein